MGRNGKGGNRQYDRSDPEGLPQACVGLFERRESFLKMVEFRFVFHR
jgi:hypothetical protein